MSTMMDIIFSSMIGGVISLIIINANFVLRDASSSYNGDMIVQQMLVNNAQVIEGELRNMGCGVPDKDIVRVAEKNRITFRTSLRPELGAPIMIISYYLGSTDELSGTDNPNDRFVYRQVNGGTPERIGTVTQLNFAYYNQANDELTAPITDASTLKEIKIVEINMEVQSPFVSFQTQDADGSIINRYSSALWKQTRLASPNNQR